VFRAVIGPPEFMERPATLTFSASRGPQILPGALPELPELRRGRGIRRQQVFQDVVPFLVLKLDIEVSEAAVGRNKVEVGVNVFVDEAGNGDLPSSSFDSLRPLTTSAPAR